MERTSVYDRKLGYLLSGIFDRQDLSDNDVQSNADVIDSYIANIILLYAPFLNLSSETINYLKLLT